MALHPCPHCARHVRHTAQSCPFCEGTLPAMQGEQTPLMMVSRAAIMAGMVSLSACDTPAPQVQPNTPPVVQTQPATHTTQTLPTTVQPTLQLLPQPGQQDPNVVPGTVPGVNPALIANGTQIAPTQIDPSSMAFRYGAPPPPIANGQPIQPPTGPADPGSQARRYGGPPRPMGNPVPAGPTDPGAAASRYGAPPLVDDFA